MIVKGAARSGPRQLAIYLMRVERYDTGEPAELLELRSPWAAGENGSRERCAAKLIEAFRDWQDLAEATQQGRDGLYRAEINPAPAYAKTMTREEMLQAVDMLEEELGFKGQDRAVVLHGGTKDRPHIHVVWSRTDLDTMKIIPDSFNYVAHERASKRMELEFGHEFVAGKHAKRDRENQPEFPRQEFDYADAQMAQRAEMTPAERKEQITALKEAAANGQELKNSLEDAGYILAQGERGYLVVDQAGVHSALSRNIQGMKKAQAEAFMADVPLDQLPTIEQAQALQKQKALSAQQAEAADAQQPQPAEMTPAERKRQITALRQQADNGQAFKNVLEEAGYVLAKGERNGFYLIDRQGEVFNLSSHTGISGKEYKAFMAGIDPASVPDIEQAKALQQRAAQARKTEAPAETKEQGLEASKFLPSQPAPKTEQPAPAPPQPEKQPTPQEAAPAAEQTPEKPEPSKFLPAETPAKAPEPAPAVEVEKPKPEDPELAGIKKALAERHAKEVHKWADLHALELRQLEYGLTKLNADSARLFAADQAVEMAALKDRLKEERKGIKGILDAIERKLNPTLAAEKTQARRREIALLKARQERELKDYLALIEQTKQLEIDNLKERQAMQRADLERKREEEQDRHISEHQEAQRIRAELEAKRIHDELEKKDSFRDGPPPPKLGK